MRSFWVLWRVWGCFVEKTCVFGRFFHKTTARCFLPVGTFVSFPRVFSQSIRGFLHIAHSNFTTVLGYFSTFSPGLIIRIVLYKKYSLYSRACGKDGI